VDLVVSRAVLFQEPGVKSLWMGNGPDRQGSFPKPGLGAGHQRRASWQRHPPGHCEVGEKIILAEIAEPVASKTSVITYRKVGLFWRSCSRPATHS
jgi:hypothetical protein